MVIDPSPPPLELFFVLSRQRITSKKKYTGHRSLRQIVESTHRALRPIADSTVDDSTCTRIKKKEKKKNTHREKKKTHSRKREKT